EDAPGGAGADEDVVVFGGHGIPAAGRSAQMQRTVRPVLFLWRWLCLLETFHRHDHDRDHSLVALAVARPGLADFARHHHLLIHQLLRPLPGRRVRQVQDEELLAALALDRDGVPVTLDVVERPRAEFPADFNTSVAVAGFLLRYRDWAGQARRDHQGGQ